MDKAIDSIKPHYRDIHRGEEIQACGMVLRSFNEFVAPGYSQEGRNEFKRYVNPEAIRERLLHGNWVTLALVEDSIIGLMEVRSNNHIALLFVDKTWHRQGVARKLVELCLERCKQNNNDLKAIEVNSSPFAVPIYERLGFTKTNNEQIENGIRYTPMKLAV